MACSSLADKPLSHMLTRKARENRASAQIKFGLANAAGAWQYPRMEKLKQYIAAQGISSRAFAQSVGLSSAGLHGLLHGRNIPSLPVAFRIEDATGGAVPARAWVDP